MFAIVIIRLIFTSHEVNLSSSRDTPVWWMPWDAHSPCINAIFLVIK